MPFRFYSTFLAIYFCNLFYQNAQNFQGTLLDFSTQKPIINAIVFQKHTSFACESDSTGTFNLTLDTTKKMVIIIEASEYQKDSLVLSNSAKTSKKTILFLNALLQSTQIEDVVISGTLTERRLSDSPIPVELYSAELFKKSPSPTLFESLTMINGVQPQINCNVCNTGDIHINGLEGPYTMVLIDGMPIVSSLASVYGFQGIPQALIKRVEVVKGPSSTLYGSESVAGLINIITKDPNNLKKITFDGSFSSLGELNLDFSNKYKISPKCNSLIGLNYFNYQIPRDINNDGFTDVTLQHRVSLFNKYEINRKNQQKMLISARLVLEDRWGGQLGYKKTLRGSDSIYSESIITNRFELIGTYSFPKMKNLKIDFSYNFHHQDSYYGILKYDAYQQTAFAQLIWTKPLKRKWQMVSGIPLRIVKYDDNTIATPTPSITILPGIFHQSEYKISPKQTGLIGIRYDYNNYHGNIITPRISYKYNFTPKTVVRLTSGSGFRVVNIFTEEHAALTGSRIVEIKNDLKPEKSWNLNLNVNQRFLIHNGFLTSDFTVFETYFTNKIIPDYVSDVQKIIFDNIQGHAISRGITINNDFQFDNGFKINAGVTILDVYKKNNGIKQPQLLTPKYNCKFALSFEFKKAKTSIDLTGDIKSPMLLPTVPNDFRPSHSPTFALIGLQMTKTVKDWQIYFGAKNILNFIPQNPLLRPFDPFDRNVNDLTSNPFGYTFDTSYNYAPIQGTKWYFGLRLNY